MSRVFLQGCIQIGIHNRSTWRSRFLCDDYEGRRMFLLFSLLIEGDVALCSQRKE